jgi:hypothetical protein
MRQPARTGATAEILQLLLDARNGWRRPSRGAALIAFARST